MFECRSFKKLSTVWEYWDVHICCLSEGAFCFMMPVKNIDVFFHADSPCGRNAKVWLRLFTNPNKVWQSVAGIEDD